MKKVLVFIAIMMVAYAGFGTVTNGTSDISFIKSKPKEEHFQCSGCFKWDYVKNLDQVETGRGWIVAPDLQVIPAWVRPSWLWATDYYHDECNPYVRCQCEGSWIKAEDESGVRLAEAKKKLTLYKRGFAWTGGVLGVLVAFLVIALLCTDRCHCKPTNS